MIALLFQLQNASSNTEIINVIIGIFSLVMMVTNGFMIYIVKDLKESVKSLKNDVDILNKRVDKIVDSNSAKIDDIKERQNVNHLELLELINHIKTTCVSYHGRNNN